MICLSENKEGAGILVDYCSGALDPARAAELEGHMVNCEDCRRLVEAQRELWTTLDQWTPPEVSPDFDARLYARIAQEARLPWWKQMLKRVFSPAAPRSLWKPALPLAAACAAMILVLLVRGPQPAGVTEPDGVKQAQNDTINMDTLEETLEDLDLLAPIGEPAEM
jgi:anti-sigma factor RsiW